MINVKRDYVTQRQLGQDQAGARLVPVIPLLRTAGGLRRHEAGLETRVRVRKVTLLRDVVNGA